MPTKPLSSPRRASSPKRPRYRVERRPHLNVVIYGAREHQWRVLGPKETILCQSVQQARRICKLLNTSLPTGKAK